MEKVKKHHFKDWSKNCFYRCSFSKDIFYKDNKDNLISILKTVKHFHLSLPFTKHDMLTLKELEKEFKENENNIKKEAIEEFKKFKFINSLKESK